MINVFQPSLGEEELDALRRVFASNWPGKGRITAQFETAFAAHLNAERQLVRSINSCTEGLFLSMPLLGIGPGDEVVLPTISFVGAGNAVVAAGATPVFCDVDPRSLNCTADSIERCLSPRTKAVLNLHYGGVPCEMDSICELLSRRNIRLIEDSACSVASFFRGRACGTFGDIGVWSFDAMKILVTGDGGMVYCRMPEMAQRAEELLYLGQGSKSGFSNPAETRWWEFDISSCGRRSVMNDLAAAIGIEQLKKLPGFLARRKEIHEFYERELRALDWLQGPPAISEGCVSSYYLYWIQTPPDRRDRLATHLKKDDIYTTFRYFPLHRVSLYASEARLPNAEAASEETLCLPLHSSLTDDDLDRILDSLRRFDA